MDKKTARYLLKCAADLSGFETLRERAARSYGRGNRALRNIVLEPHFKHPAVAPLHARLRERAAAAKYYQEKYNVPIDVMSTVFPEEYYRPRSVKNEYRRLIADPLIPRFYVPEKQQIFREAEDEVKAYAEQLRKADPFPNSR